MRRPKKTRARLRVPGGILLVNELRSISEFALTHGIGAIRIGIRQDLRLDGVPPQARDWLTSIRDRFDLETEPAYGAPNITSTAPAIGVVRTTTWASETTYLRMIERLPSLPSIRICVADENQSWMPARCGDLTLVASGIPQYWRLGITTEDARQYVSEFALHEEVIPNAVALFSDLIGIDAKNAGQCLQKIWSAFSHDALVSEEHPSMPRRELVPECAGLHARGDGDGHWLGIPEPDAGFDPAFLSELCVRLSRRGVSKVGLTPWRTLVISGVAEEDVHLWRQWVACKRVSIRTDRFLSGCLIGDERNARALAAATSDALDAEGFVPRRPAEISFCSDPRDGFAAVRIAQVNVRRRLGRRRTYYSLSIEGSEAKRLDGPQLLRALVASFRKKSTEPIERPAVLRAESAPVREAMMCADCGNVYEARIGDIRANVPAGTSFDQLPSDWICPVCEASRDRFVPTSLAAEAAPGR